jgi:exosortase/archaeosortase family protein
MKRPIWYRAVLLFSAIPIALVINIIRVVGTGMILQYGNPEWTHGTLHTLEGLIMVALGMGLIGLEIKILDWIIESPTPTTPPSPALLKTHSQGAA